MVEVQDRQYLLFTSDDPPFAVVGAIFSVLLLTMRQM